VLPDKQLTLCHISDKKKRKRDNVIDSDASSSDDGERRKAAPPCKYISNTIALVSRSTATGQVEKNGIPICGLWAHTFSDSSA
jgi:hypothetical protein